MYPNNTQTPMANMPPEGNTVQPVANSNYGMPPVDPNVGMPPQQNQWNNSPINGNNPHSPWTNYGSPSSGFGSGSNDYIDNWNGNPSAGAEAGAADYQGVQDFSDAAYNNARRYLDPQQAYDNRRFDQELINRGIDPTSDYGQQMYADMMRAHGDQDQGAAFGAMEFGQNIQEQMFRQNYDNTRQAGDMEKAQWADQSNRYGIDAGYKTGMGNLELGRQKQDFNEMGFYDSVDYRNQMYNDSRDDRMQNIAMWMAGQGDPQADPNGAGSTPAGLNPWGTYGNNMADMWFPQ